MAETDPAARQFWTLQLARFSAVVLVFLGAAIIGGAIPLPEAAGYALLVIGAAEFFVLPYVLSRRWKDADR